MLRVYIPKIVNNGIIIANKAEKKKAITINTENNILDGCPVKNSKILLYSLS